jgi:hypothetical protein
MGDLSFYAITTSFSSSDDDPKTEAGAAPTRPTAGSCYLKTRPADWSAGYRYPELT